ARNKKDRKDKVPVYNADINFYNTLNDEQVLLGTVKTNNEGIAKIVLPSDQNYLIDEEGFINFLADFEGTDALKRKDSDLVVKDLFLELNLEEIDSVKTVLVNAFVLDSLKIKQPIEEADIVFSVGGMISRMPIEDGSIEDGTYEFEFPEGIKGNKEGHIDVYAFIEDHDEYGNVLAKQTKPWGTKLEIQDSNLNNKLWTDFAPIWMYILLSILLIGVWANFVYTIFNLFKIRKECKQLDT
ncbi:MAG: hypothetical protein KJN82_07565, partial [Bacteroidia bacterium]|nr:hypothetical protein [Bacteroidia bacterium]